MLKKNLTVFSIPDEDKNNNTVIRLAELLKQCSLEMSNLRDEIARLKGNPAKPKLKPSKIAKNDPSIAKKRNKKFSTANTQPKKIKIHEEITLKPDNIPAGSRLVKVHPYTVEFLHNYSPLVTIQKQQGFGDTTFTLFGNSPILQYF